MSLLKCKICGDTLYTQDGINVSECPVCHTVQTVPFARYDSVVNILNEADMFRRTKQFDKAIDLLKEALSENPFDIDINWRMALCRYGVVYKNDFESGRIVPKVYRSQPVSLFDDRNYVKAFSLADNQQKNIIHKQASEIESVHKAIHSIADKEKPFDVFICHKEKDETGALTSESLLAQNIYFVLSSEGYKVFCSEITLENKSDSDKQAYIYSGITSSKVMLVLGTSRESFEDISIKNEWSTFKRLLPMYPEKILIPSFKDMRQADIPHELAAFGAKDLGRISYMDDISKIIGKVLEGKTDEITDSDLGVDNTLSISELVQNIITSLSIGNWTAADEYCENVLDIDPKNPQAYLGRLMSELKCRTRDSLKYCADTFDNNYDYIMCTRFCDDELKNELSSYIEYINDRNRKQIYIHSYNQALQKMNDASNEEEMTEAAEAFRKIADFMDAAQKADECLRKAAEYHQNTLLQQYYAALNMLNTATTEQQCIDAANEFMKLSGMWDADKKAQECQVKYNEIYRNRITSQYYSAMNLMNTASTEQQCIDAANAFRSMGGIWDTEQKAAECMRRAEELRQASLIPNYNSAVAMLNSALTEQQCEQAEEAFRRISGFRDADQKLIECQKKAEKIREARLLPFYNSALSALDTAETEEELARVKEMFESLSGFRDSAKRIKECDEKAELLRHGSELLPVYNNALDIMSKANDRRQFERAAREFRKASGFRDADKKYNECIKRSREFIIDDKYMSAVQEVRYDKIESLERAITKFTDIIDYKDSAEKIEYCHKRIAEIKQKERQAELDWQKERDDEKLKEKKKKRKRNIAIAAVVVGVILAIIVPTVVIPEIRYSSALGAADSGDYEGAIATFTELGDFKDSAEQINATYYKQGDALSAGGNVAGAIEAYSKAEDYNDSAKKLANLIVTSGNVGDTFILGSYYDEMLTWRIIDTSNGVVAILEKTLRSSSYTSDNENVTWESSDVRDWLNHDFYNYAFSKKQKAYIKEAVNANGKDTETEDHVWLLAEDEAKKFFSDSSSRTSDSSWWLRTLSAPDKAVCVTTDGTLSPGEDVTSSNGVRPVILITAA